MYVRKEIKKNASLRKGVSTAITAIIIAILVVAAGAAVYFYTTSTVTPSTTTNVQTSITTKTNVSTQTSVSTKTVAPPPQPVTITVWATYAPSSSANSEFGAFNKSLTAFKAAYPYITVNLQTHPFGSAQADFVVASLANQAPDVLRGANDWTGALVAEGFLTTIDQFTNSTFLGQYFPASIQDYQFRGHTYGLPENINHLALIYNKALVPNPPTTTDQLIQMAQSITKVDSTCKITTAGIAFNAAGGFGGGYWWWPFLNGFGGSVFSATKPTQPAINSTAAVASVVWLNSLVTAPNPHTNCNGVMPPGADYTTADALFISGHAGMLINGPWDISNIMANKSLNFGVAALPTVSSTGLPLAPFIGSQGWMIASGKPAAETAAAFKFIAWMTNFNSQKNMVTMAGDLPAIKALANDPSVTGNPSALGFLAQAANGSPAVNIPEMGVVYADIGGPLGTAQPASAASIITAAQIQTALNTAETAMLRAIGSIG